MAGLSRSQNAIRIPFRDGSSAPTNSQDVTKSRTAPDSSGTRDGRKNLHVTHANLFSRTGWPERWGMTISVAEFPSNISLYQQW